MAFGAVRALTEVSLEIGRAEILGLVGANGAGKSTLIRILTGDLAPDAGEILVAGQPVALTSVRDAFRLGIGVVRQELDLVPDLTVAENLYLGEEGRFTRRGVLNRGSMERASVPLLESVGLSISPRARVRRLSIGDRQLVACARALRDAATILLLDEPTSSLTPWETERLFATIRRLAASGVGVVYISHRLEEVAALCHRVTVIRDGRVVGDFGDPRSQLDSVVAAMTPGLTAMSREDARRSAGDIVLEVRDLVVGGRGPATFHVRRGEVVGVFGLVGAGRSTIARALIGANRPRGGEVRVAGRLVNITSPWHGFREGIAYLPEDRKAESVLPGMSIRHNIGIRAPGDTSRYGILRMKALGELARRMIARLSIRAPSDLTRIDHLSGGNQQKVVLGRLLTESLDVLVLDEPTHGIDVAAKQELLSTLRSLAAEGKGILLVSSELPELLAAADRVLVLRNGRVVGEFKAADAREADIVGAAAGRPAVA